MPPHSREVHSSEQKTVWGGSRVSGKKRKRGRQRNACNFRQNCTDSVPSGGARWSGGPNSVLRGGLASGDVDESVVGPLYRPPIGGSGFFIDEGKEKKEMMREMGQSDPCNCGEFASTEMEKESLRSWVERGLKRQADWTISHGEQDGLVLGRRHVLLGHSFSDRDYAAAEKRFVGQEDGAVERTFVNSINGVGENSYRNDRVLQYVMKRSVVIRHPPSPKSLSSRARTIRTDVFAWGKRISVTITSEASTIREWICGQSGCLFGLDVEWRPNRVRGEENKAALLQLCGEKECLIIQLLFLDSMPEALTGLLFNPLKRLAGVGIYSDSKRLLKDYGLVCQGEVELTILAAERMKREELKHVGLKALVLEVLGLNMKKSKKITLSNWAKLHLDHAQVEYACIDAWVSFALSQKLTAESSEGI